MKLLKLLSLFFVGVAVVSLASCQNQDIEFDNFDGGSAVYFAYQYPVRTIVLGEDVYDTTSDNEHRFAIYAVMGGVYANKSKVTIDVQVDNTLVDNLYFDAEATDPVKAMPGDYYTMADTKIVLDKAIQGAVGVQLNQAFFDDPKALTTTYVVPLVMRQVQGADSILSGRRLVTGDPVIDNAPRTNPAGWDPDARFQPKDYVLYAVKFINPWHASYLRRGVDQVTAGGTTTQKIRHAATVEKDQVISLTSDGLTRVIMRVTATAADGTTIPCDLLLTFNGGLDGKDATCTVSAITEGMTASGSGTWVIKGEKKAWGNKDRNALYLDYTVDFGSTHGQRFATRDTLVFRDRGIKRETFTPTYLVKAAE